jgi:hypothetical protein
MDDQREETFCPLELRLRNNYYLLRHNEVLTILFVHLNLVLIFESLSLLNNHPELLYEMLPI